MFLHFVEPRSGSCMQSDESEGDFFTCSLCMLGGVRRPPLRWPGVRWPPPFRFCQKWKNEGVANEPPFRFCQKRKNEGVANEPPFRFCQKRMLIQIGLCPMNEGAPTPKRDESEGVSMGNYCS